MQALNELQQALLQTALARLRQLDEAEGLEPALSRPHGKQHLGLLADGDLSEMKDQFDFELLFERLFHMHQAPGDGKLMEFAAHLPPVGQPHKRQDGSPKLDPKRAVLAAGQSL